MSDDKNAVPTGGNGPDIDGLAIEGHRGERAGDPAVDHPEQRRTVQAEDRTITVEEQSGTAYAESTGAQDKQPPDLDANGGTENETFSVNADRPEAGG